MSFPETLRCPNRFCIDGMVVDLCPRCEGEGATQEADPCPGCQGSGEGTDYECPTCEGTGRVPFARAQILDAAERVRAFEPGWSGDDIDHPGVTLYSLAMWNAQRATLGGIVRARGRTSVGRNQGVFEVDLIDADRRRVTLHGLSWGYGGEGCVGLACVLTDAGLFEDVNAAMVFVAELDREAPWVYAARELEDGEQQEQSQGA